jgi:hypothetical protein
VIAQLPINMNSSTLDFVTRIHSREDLPELLAAERAVAMLSVDWSGPERKGRERFLALAHRWQDAGLPPVQFFLINEDDDTLRDFFPRQIRCACVPLGAGAVHWLARGKVLRSEMQIADCPVSQLVAWTAELWPAELGPAKAGGPVESAGESRPGEPA